MNYYKYLLTTVLLFITIILHSQNDSIISIQIASKIIDAKTKKPIEFALIIIERDTFKKQKYSNQDGEFLFDSILPGVYSISVSFPGYTKQTYQCVQITKKNIVSFNRILLSPKVIYIDFDIIGRPKLISTDNPTHDNFNSRQIMRMPY
ncbi:MAG: carboxypeptidase regulatory-like domain-containing protein [Bacteroidota bacterium]